MPRFVLLLHTLPADSPRPSHWDFMLEDSGVLRTWALDEAPRLGHAIAATQLPDHRLDYLTYEGEVSGNRGTVSRVVEGEYTLLDEQPTQLILLLRGSELAGRVTLTNSPTDQRWRFVLEADAALVGGSSS
jgi:hypothetical protein